MRSEYASLLHPGLISMAKFRKSQTISSVGPQGIPGEASKMRDLPSLLSYGACALHYGPNENVTLNRLAVKKYALAILHLDIPTS
jgi:hypothetical protein